METLFDFRPEAGKVKPMSLQTLIEQARKQEPTGEQLKQEGMNRVITNSPDEYKQAFSEAIAARASTGTPFTAEDVTEICGYPPQGSHPNLVGALVSKAAKELGLTRLGYITSRRKRSHAAVIALWQLK